MWQTKTSLFSAEAEYRLHQGHALISAFTNFLIFPKQDGKKNCIFGCFTERSENFIDFIFKILLSL